MFIGRETELRFLNDLYQKKESQLIFLYGRRRVGKTETLKKFSEDKPSVFFVCKECPDSVQLKAFSERMFREELPAKKYISSFENWEQAFRGVTELPFSDRKKLLIIDEFPHMCKGNMSIPSIIQNLWDYELKYENVMLVFCGSAMSFIEKELLAEKNPLYGRATGIYKMEPMGFYDAKKFFPNYSETDQVAAYSILGGIPHYLAQFDDALSLEENIKRNILKKGCALYSEVEFLLHQELRETAVYNSVIEAVALGSTKLNEITQKSLIGSTTKTNVYLKNLLELKIIRKEFSVDVKLKEQANKNRGEYFLTDPFFRFWYTFAFRNLSDLEAGDADGVYQYDIAPKLDQFTSYTFEEVCREYVQKRKLNQDLPFRYEKMGRWYGTTMIRRKNDVVKGTTEIDLVALSEREKKLIIGECKYKNGAFTYSDYLDTVTKLGTLKEENEFYYMFFSKSGFDSRVAQEAEQSDHITLCTIEEIVNYM